MTKNWGSSDLIASFYTLSGGPVLEPSRHDFDDRVTAAAAAGYTGIGLSLEDYEACLGRGWTPQDMRHVLDEHRIAVGEVEFLAGWAYDDARARRDRCREERLYALVDALGGHRIHVGFVDPPSSLPPQVQVAARLGALSDRAAAHDLVVAFEFFPYSAVPDIAAAWGLVSLADRPNLGVLVDSWHFYRGSGGEAALREVPPQKIVGIQLADADADVVGDLEEDTVKRRRLPGEGALDVVRLVTVLHDMGVEAAIGVEIISETHAALPLHEAATRSAETAKQVIELGRGASAGSAS